MDWKLLKKELSKRVGPYHWNDGGHWVVIKPSANVKLCLSDDGEVWGKMPQHEVRMKNVSSVKMTHDSTIKMMSSQKNWYIFRMQNHNH
jgi:hypothetical protein